MKLSENKGLKIEILSLPSKEKDKLLLRLIAKDKVLTEHLHFLLLEDEENLKARVESIKEKVKVSAKAFTNSKDVLVNLRNLMRLINHFFKVTKANFEEVELKIFLLNNTEVEFKSRTFSAVKNYEQLLAVYFVKSIISTLKKFDKLHEDLQFDLHDDMNKLLSKAYQKSTAIVAEDLGLPRDL
ncbi:MAG: hypothetical protein ACQUHE_15220 [Bacteroidia bacterium]